MKIATTSGRRDGRLGLWTAAAVVLSSLAGGYAYAQLANMPAGAKAPKWSALPDWNGVWERDGDLVWDDRIPPGQSQAPPYTAEYAKKAAAAPPSGPVGPGMPAMMTMVFPMEIEINPRETLIIGESNTLRRIYTDGREHPVDPLPSTAGHSIGKWKGKTLLVDTCCVKSNVRLPGAGPHSDDLRITERMWMPDADTWRDEITVLDPSAFTKPWTTVKTFRRRPDWEPIEYDRQENDRDTPAGRVRGQGAPTVDAPVVLPADVKFAAGPEAVRLQKATANSVGAMAWEGVKVFDIQHAGKTVKWQAATRSSLLHCTAEADGSNPACDH